MCLCEFCHLELFKKLVLFKEKFNSGAPQLVPYVPDAGFVL